MVESLSFMPEETLLIMDGNLKIICIDFGAMIS